MLIRVAKEKDIAKLVEFDQKLYTLHENLKDPHPLAKRGQKGITKRLTRYLVAELNGQIVGTLYFKKVARYLVVSHIWVEDCCRKQGIGAALLKTAIKIGKEKGCKSIKLTVRDVNTDAKEMYSKLGFVPGGVLLFLDIE